MPGSFETTTTTTIKSISPQTQRTSARSDFLFFSDRQYLPPFPTPKQSSYLHSLRRQGLPFKGSLHRKFALFQVACWKPMVRSTAQFQHRFLMSAVVMLRNATQRQLPCKTPIEYHYSVPPYSSWTAIQKNSIGSRRHKAKTAAGTWESSRRKVNSVGGNKSWPSRGRHFMVGWEEDNYRLMGPCDYEHMNLDYTKSDHSLWWWAVALLGFQRQQELNLWPSACK